MIHDNGARPFLLDINTEARAVTVSKPLSGWDYAKQGRPTVKDYLSPIHTWFRSPQVFIGDVRATSSTRRTVGNTCLIQMSVPGYYVYVGERIYEFNTIGDQPVTDYYSYIGRNDVPYPVALTRDYVYLPGDMVVIPRGSFPPKQKWAKAAFTWINSPEMSKSGSPIEPVAMIQERKI